MDIKEEGINSEKKKWNIPRIKVLPITATYNGFSPGLEDFEGTYSTN